MAKAQDQQLRLELLMDELERSREEVGFREAARVRIMNWGSVIMLVLLLLSYRIDFTMAALALPFVAVYLVAQFGYHTQLVAHHRICAGELESKINGELGDEVLFTESIAADQLGGIEKPGFLGINSANVASMFSAATLHYLVICLVMFVGGAMRTRYILSRDDLKPVASLGDVYFHVLILWTVINVAYLVWYFGMSDDLKSLAGAVRKKLAPKE